MQKLLLKNCKIFDPKLCKGKDSLLVADGKIARVGKKLKAKDAQSFDCRGLFVVPGFIDVHLQGAGGHGLLEKSRTAFIEVSKTALRTGTTSYLATTEVLNDGKEEHLALLAKCIKDPLFPYSKPVGIHLEGPFVNILKKGMLNTSVFGAPTVKRYNAIYKATGKTLKMLTIAPELKGALPLVRKMKRQGVVAALGHSMASYEEAKSGIAAGVDHVTHLFNAMTPLDHKKPGAFYAVLENKKVAVQLISDGVHVHPAVLRLVYKIFGAERICLITDGLPNLGLPDGKYVYGGRAYESRNGTCYYANGTLIGTALPLNQAAKRMQEFTDAGFSDILRMLSTTPAKAIGAERKGEIKPGKDADLAVIDKNFKVHAAVVAGKLYKY